MGTLCSGWQLLHCPRAQGWNRHANAENSVTEARNDVIVSEAVDGVDEVGPPAKGVGAAGADADLQGEFDRTDRGRPPCGFEMPGHRSGKEHGGRAEERGVDDLEVGMGEGEGGFSTRAQGPEPQALHGLGLVAGWVGTATGDLRVHRAPLSSGLADAVG